MVVGKWESFEAKWWCKAGVAMWMGEVVILVAWSCVECWCHEVACSLLLVGNCIVMAGEQLLEEYCNLKW